MTKTAFDEKKLKGILKSAFKEALIENRELVQDIVEDALEDMALGSSYRTRP